MNFGQAIEALKRGLRVTRAGWNGKGMYLAYQPGYPDGIPINANTSKATGLPEGTVCKFLPYVTMRTADGSFVPWLCSQTDMLADDWDVLGEPGIGQAGQVDQSATAPPQGEQAKDKVPHPGMTMVLNVDEFAWLGIQACVADLTGKCPPPRSLLKKLQGAIDADNACKSQTATQPTR
jgi:hypothetical protein